MISISVIIPTYNPKAHILRRTLQALREQTLPLQHWELVMVDNNSADAIDADISWHLHSCIIREPKPGLTSARLAGIKASVGSIIVMVDDDNLLDHNYLKNALDIFTRHPFMGAAGGKSIPDFEIPPPAWLKEFYNNLALRNPGEYESVSKWDNKYPADAPIGAGMVLRRQALKTYISKKHTISDRSGNALSSGGDNDMVIEALKSGWQVGYFPSLSLTHVIPAARMSEHYLANLIHQTNKSWVQLLHSHQICPWPNISALSLPFRKAKAWFTYRAWKKPIGYIKWRGACGLFDGLAYSVNDK
ncbi:hypothetical protein GCM10027037_24080 [Mucilaginibacter koreensis]